MVLQGQAGGPGRNWADAIREDLRHCNLIKAVTLIRLSGEIGILQPTQDDIACCVTQILVTTRQNPNQKQHGCRRTGDISPVLILKFPLPPSPPSITDLNSPPRTFRLVHFFSENYW